MKHVPAILTFCVTVAISFTLAFAQTAPQSQGVPSQGQPLVFRNQIIMDQPFMGMEAGRLLVPKDWLFNGGITWNFSKNPPESFIAYTVSSPDGGSAIQQFPHLNMYWSPDQMSQYSFAQTGFTIMQPWARSIFSSAYLSPRPGRG